MYSIFLKKKTRIIWHNVKCLLLQTAATQKRVTQSMSGVVKAMESALRSMNLEKVQNLMDRFEKDFENLDVQSATMEGSMTATTTLNAPQAQVNALIQEAADKAGYVFFPLIFRSINEQAEIVLG